MIYFVDVNLPKSFAQIEGITCLYVKNYSDEMPDSDIWDMALTNGYVILTRDKDFYNRAMQSKIIPKIVLFRLGNCRSAVLFNHFKDNLLNIHEYLKTHQLLVLWPNEIQIVI